MTTTVSIRELKYHLSEYLRRVQAGDDLVITSHRKRIARLSGIPQAGATGRGPLAALEGVRWNGGKPLGGRLRPAIAGKTAAERVLEDRR